MESVQMSKLHQSVPEQQICAAVQAAFGLETEIVQVRELQGGLFNTTYLVETVNPCGKWILRVVPEEKEHLLSFEQHMMEIESYIYRLLGENGIPCSRVVRYDDSCRWINRPYIIIEYIDSVQLNDPSISREEYARLKEELGRYTRRMHDITSTTFGWPEPDGSIRGHSSWSRVLIDYAEETADKCKRHQLFQETVIDSFLNIFYDNNDLFDEITVPSLVHNDLWDPNVLVSRDERGKVKIAAIIDADRAMYADREFEFIVYENDPLFMKGYGLPLQMDRRSMARRKAYETLVAFTLAFVYSVQLELPEQAAAAKKSAHDQLTAFKALLNEDE